MAEVVTGKQTSTSTGVCAVALVVPGVVLLVRAVAFQVRVAFLAGAVAFKATSIYELLRSWCSSIPSVVHRGVVKASDAA